MSTSPGPDGDNRPGHRRAARERALSLLYEAELKACTPSSLLTALPVAPDAYVVDLLEGVDRLRDEIDRLVGSHVIGWTPERMPLVDRLVCDIATYELIAETSIPVAVVLSEAVELAKKFSTEDSGRFVNGVLAAVAAEVRPSRDG